MALHAYDHGRPSGLPLAVVLGSIPSYPRPVIERLVTRLIEHLDEQDGDPDLEDDDSDFCLAGDDGVFSGPTVRDALGFWGSPQCVGMDEDMEREGWPTIGAQSELSS